MRKILIIYATYGSGHKSIAKYIRDYFWEKNPNLDIKMIDMIDYSKKTGLISKKISENLMLNHPVFWSALFKWADHKYTSKFTNRVSLNWFCKKNLEKDIQDFNPDLVISTHFYGSTFIADLNKKKIINSKLITVVTDYEAHNIWLSHYEKGEYIIAPSKEEKKSLSRKIPKKYIKDYGIPIFPKEKDISRKREILKRLSLNPNKQTCLCFSGGGNGSTATIPYIKGILKVHKDLNYIFVSGNNTKAYNKISKLIKKYNIKGAKLYGFANNVPELLIASDFVVSKPGGAQSTECLYFKKPMFLIKSSGGQENDNISYFTKRGYAKFFKSPKKLSKYFAKLEKNQPEIEKMRNNLSKADNRKAMKKLYSLAVSVLTDVKAK